jgi:hypothetical protein
MSRISSQVHLTAYYLSFLLFGIALFVSDQAHAQDNYPSTTTFMNAFASCAGNLRISIQGNIEGSVRTLYEGAKTKGNVSASFESDFLKAFPEDQRQAAYQLYTTCFTGALSTRIDPRFIPDISVQIMPPRAPNDPPGFIGITFQRAEPANVGYAQFRALSVSHLCRGRPEQHNLHSNRFGHYWPYDPKTRLMVINEAKVFYPWQRIVSDLKFREGFDCIVGAG